MKNDIKIDVVIISYNRLNELKETVNNVLYYRDSINQLLIIDNCSKDGTKDWLQSIKNEKIEIILNNKNSGVSGGRNLGIIASSADILVFLDDDAVFCHTNINPFYEIKKKFISNRRLGIIAFKITNFYSKEVLKYEFPFVDKNIDQNIERKCAYYIGAGHAIKKKLFDICGFYREDFFYGKEELDFSLRVINKDYEIIYDPLIEIFHKQSPSGRQQNKEKWAQVYRNRLIISYIYYPFIYALTANFLWFLKILIISKSIHVAYEGYRRFIKVKSSLDKNLLNSKSMEYIKKNSGRLFF
ncbi:glycosyltransferase family 2 protein [Campylobacter concisus]|jgi:hypothetical protein|uniref:glycosyltransferase family 2 protein n=1 Tax=Campylobacter concisus TaxID=199 RepID=UPI000CD8B67D|nr:glycosyltransferase [Campylobacter concisus]